LCQLLSGFSILDNPFGFLYVYIMCYTSKLVVARVCSSVSLVSTSVSLFFLFDDVHFRFCKLFFVFIILYDSHKPGESVKFLHQVRSQSSSCTKPGVGEVPAPSQESVKFLYRARSQWSFCTKSGVSEAPAPSQESVKFLHQVRRVSEVPSPSQESQWSSCTKSGESVKFLHQVRSQWSCIYVLRVFILPLSTIFFGIFLMAWYFVFPLISNDSIMYIQGQRKYFKCNTL
jgi:hypothetical protein